MSGSRRITVNGQVFNTGEWVDGVLWEIEEVTGMGDPASVFSSEQNVAADGVWATTGYRGPRAVGFVGRITADDETRAELAMDVLRRLITLDEFPVTFHYASGDRTVWVRRDGEVTQQTREQPEVFDWTVGLRAIDPAIYAGDPSGSQDIVLSTGLPKSDGGLTFPVTFPVTFTGTSATGDVVVDLDGGGRLGLRVDGLCNQPQIVVENSLGTFRLAWYAILADGMWLDIDPQNRSALLQGQASRPPNVRLWPRLAPGHNILRFRAADYSSNARLTVTIRPTL